MFLDCLSIREYVRAQADTFLTSLPLTSSSLWFDADNN